MVIDQPVIARKFITATEVAKLTGIKIGTLRNWRTTKQGPSYHKLGAKVAYEYSEVKSWIESQKIECQPTIGKKRGKKN